MTRFSEIQPDRYTEVASAAGVIKCRMRQYRHVLVVRPQSRARVEENKSVSVGVLTSADTGFQSSLSVPEASLARV